MPADRDAPLVSCVIPFLDAERHLAEAIESVIAQTYDRWELVLVDDGSTDGSRGIAERHRRAAADKIRILHHAGNRNRGKSVSRNAGVRASGGELIAFLDADDVWLPRKLDEQVRILAAHPDAGATYGPVRYWYSWTGRPRDRHRDLVSKVGFAPDVLVPPPKILTRFLEVMARRDETISPYPSSFVVRRSAFEDAGGFEEDFPRLYDDVIFFAKLLARHSAYISAEVLALYRLRPDAQYSESYARALEEGQWRDDAPSPAEGAFLQRLRDHLTRQGLARGRLGRALKMALLPYERPALGRALDGARSAAKALRGRAHAGVRAIAPGLRPGAEIAPGKVRWGDIGATPVARADRIGGRGGAIPDLLFARFASHHAALLPGPIGEVGDDSIARRVGGRSTAIIPYATLEVPHPRAGSAGPYACVIAHDILRFSRDPLRMLDALAALLEPRGVLLTSMTTVAPVLPGDDDRWRFTLAGTHTLFAESHAFDLTDAMAVGDLRMSVAVLNNLGSNDLDEGALDGRPSSQPALILVKARRVGPKGNPTG